VSAEQGIALPGLSVVCPDSHTCTLGALGCLAWGIGTSDCEQALATEVLRVRKPRQMRIWCDGAIPAGVTAKDLALFLIAEHGAAGAAGHAVEFAGPAIGRVGLQSRFTLCNMAVEFSAFTAVIAPDLEAIEYAASRPRAPLGESGEAARRHWESLKSDAGATFDREIRIDCSRLRPMVSWGTNPAQAIRIDAPVPRAAEMPDDNQRQAAERALKYMGITSGKPLQGLPIQAAFIGSCTNSRLVDLRAAAGVLRGQRVAPGIKAICVPGSTATRHAAEREGLDRVFTEAGFEWREAGCSLCFHAGGEGFAPGERVISTTNRNFEGRQGPGVRTHLASPLTVAASAIAGAISAADARGL
jgi:3-isopropylmalate/(R)-2-methylmalate dehydratase large subunit